MTNQNKLDSLRSKLRRLEHKMEQRKEDLTKRRAAGEIVRYKPTPLAWQARWCDLTREIEDLEVGITEEEVDKI